jgi:hypothetical protein
MGVITAQLTMTTTVGTATTTQATTVAADQVATIKPSQQLHFPILNSMLPA